jgi:abortive infection bacteriophage resistance protein
MPGPTAYARPWKSFADQLELLKARGLHVHDEERALAWLQRVGYYRLSAYWYPFRVFHHARETGTVEVK